MQLLFDASDEADTACLGLIPGRVRAMAPAPGLPVPHMGWTAIEDAAPGIGLADGDYVYFAHGFACPDTPATAARATYGDAIPALWKQTPRAKCSHLPTSQNKRQQRNIKNNC